MQFPINKDLYPLATELRHNATRQQLRLWRHYLRKYPMRFTQQKVIGDYIVDFFCSQARLAIDLYGYPQPEDRPKRCGTPEEREDYLREHGLWLLRIPNADVDLRFEKVCLDIAQATIIGHIRPPKRKRPETND